MHPYSIATRSLKLFLSEPQVLSIVHYACESFYNKREPTRICAIAVKHPTESKVFSIHQYCVETNTAPEDLVTDAGKFAEAEQKLLEQFFQYAANQGEHARWLHWNMNSQNYGFAHLESRYKTLVGRPAFHIPESKRLDLDATLQEIYGQPYMCDPKLVNLVKQNGLMRKHFLSGDREASSFLAGKWQEIEDSAQDKVEIIFQVANLALRKKLKTHIGYFQANIGNWLGAVISEHPIVFWTTSISFVASVASLCGQFLQYAPRF